MCSCVVRIALTWTGCSLFGIVKTVGGCFRSWLFKHPCVHLVNMANCDSCLVFNMIEWLVLMSACWVHRVCVAAAIYLDVLFLEEKRILGEFHVPCGCGFRYRRAFSTCSHGEVVRTVFKDFPGGVNGTIRSCTGAAFAYPVPTRMCVKI